MTLLHHVDFGDGSLAIHERAIRVGAKLRTKYGPRRPNSAHINGQPWTPSDKWFTLVNGGGPIWGSRGREFKSRQPDTV